MIDEDAKTILRTLRDTLLETRPHVEAAQEVYRGLLLEVRAAETTDVLERVDGAIAEADEVLT